MASANKKKNVPAAAADNACHLLLAALKVAPPETHPPAPFHMGGPAPKIDAFGYVHVMHWLASLVDSQVDPRDRETFDAHLARSKRELARPANKKPSPAALRELFDADAKKVSRIPAKIGAWVAHETSNWLARPIYAGGAARPAAANYVRLLLKKDPNAVKPFLADLDRRCLHFEVLGVLRDRDASPKRAAIRETLWRGHQDGKVTHWLMRLADKAGSLALLYKEKTRWQLVEGARDDVLAHVHDEQQLVAAVNAAVMPV